MSDLESRFREKLYWRDIVTMMMQPAIELEIMVRELRDTREISKGCCDPKSRQLLGLTTSGSPGVALDVLLVGVGIMRWS